MLLITNDIDFKCITNTIIQEPTIPDIFTLYDKTYSIKVYEVMKQYMSYVYDYYIYMLYN